jgi:hypothetical protein
MSSFMTTSPRELTGGRLRMRLLKPVSSFLFKMTGLEAEVEENLKI